MLTSMKLSSISYNSEFYLKFILNQLLKCNYISFWAYIKHKPEEDELKEHIHFMLIPADRVDTVKISELLVEFTEVGDLPLRSLPIHKVLSFDDWYLYNIHDKSYLLTKNQTRRYHYKREDFVCSDLLYFTELIHHIDYSKFTRMKEVIDMIDKGYSFSDIVRKGNIPINQFLQYKGLYESMVQIKIDEATGEVIEEEHTNRGKRGKTHQ